MIRRFLNRAGSNGQVALPPLPILANLELFLRSDVGVFKDAGLTQPAGNGDQVNGWADQSGHGRHATGPIGLRSFPLYNTGASPKGRSLVQFFAGTPATSNQGQLSGAFPPAGLGSVRGYTFYSWLNETAYPTNGALFPGQRLFGAEISTGVRLDVEDYQFSAGKNLITGVIGNTPFNGPQRWTAVYNAPTDGSVQTHTLTVNGVSVSNSSGVAMSLNTSYLVSGNGAGNLCFGGQLGCLLVYTDQHTAGQQAQVVNWMTIVFG